MKILNLYAGIGGNRKLWNKENLGMDIEVTAVEINPEIAKIYQEFFPDDKVIITDAHQFLLEHFEEFDFIWSSPPCPTHSHIRKVFYNQNKPVYPDMKLYEEIVFLQGYFRGLWVVENVISWYNPLIKPYEVGGHYFWSNFIINTKRFKPRKHYGNINELENRKGFVLKNFKGINKIKILRNCVEPELGLHILKCALKERQLSIKEVLK